jgi:hypothetical protein
MSTDDDAKKKGLSGDETVSGAEDLVAMFKLILVKINTIDTLDGYRSLPMASVANLPHPTMEEKSLVDLTLRELVDLSESKLAAEEKAESTAVLVQPVVVVPKTPTPLVSSESLPLPRKKTEKKATAAPVSLSTHHRPMVCLLCCGVCQKCKVSRHPL